MSINKKLNGTPWHVEILRKAENDSRRHKSRGQYYSKHSGSCNKTNRKCTGSAHCKYYYEKHKNNKKNECDDIDSIKAITLGELQLKLQKEKQLKKDQRYQKMQIKRARQQENRIPICSTEVNNNQSNYQNEFLKNLKIGVNIEHAILGVGYVCKI